VSEHGAFLRRLAFVGFFLMAGSMASGRVVAQDSAEPAAAEPDAAAPDSAAPDAASEVSDPPSETAPLPDDAAEKPYWRQNLFGRFFRDQKFAFTTWWPSEFRRWQFTAPLLAGVAIAATPTTEGGGGLDYATEDYIRRRQQGHSNQVSHELSTLGNVGPALVLIGAGYLFGRLGGHDQIAEASSLSAEAMLTSGLYCTVLKKLTARARPSGGADGAFFQYHPQDGETIGSFPSGHATGAFTVATVFAETYKDDHRWVPWAAYGAASLVGLSRLTLHRHFVGDVIVGGVIGNSVGRMVTARQRESQTARFEVEPFFDPKTAEAGVLWTRRF